MLYEVITIVIFDLFNNKIIGRHDIERLTRAPIIGYISHSDYHIEDPVAQKPGSTLAESFRAVRTSLAFYTGQTKCPVIRITSYNVCYTKLLRPEMRAEYRRWGIRAVAGAPLLRDGKAIGAIMLSVITSYSIHYTKLYDHFRRAGVAEGEPERESDCKLSHGIPVVVVGRTACGSEA